MSAELPRRPLLLVEDNPVDLDLTLRAFRRSGLRYPVEVARDGEEALGWLARWCRGAPLPLVMLLDLKLPRVDGLEVLRQLRAAPVSRRLPVVALTSSRDERDVFRAYEHGVSSYIVKPLEFDTFLDVARQIDRYWCALNEPPPQPQAGQPAP